MPPDQGLVLPRSYRKTALHFRKHSGPWSCYKGRTPHIVLPQVPAEALDAGAGILEIFGGGGVRDAERRAHSEGCAMHDGNAFLFQQGGGEHLVIGDGDA